MLSHADQVNKVGAEQVTATPSWSASWAQKSPIRRFTQMNPV